MSVKMGKFGFDIKQNVHRREGIAPPHNLISNAELAIPRAAQNLISKPLQCHTCSKQVSILTNREVNSVQFRLSKTEEHAGILGAPGVESTFVAYSTATIDRSRCGAVFKADQAENVEFVHEEG